MLETGEFDYAWNLQVEPEVLAQMAVAGKGTVVTAFGTSVERLMVNQTNDDPSLGPEKRSLYLDGANPHPFLSDPAVRRALSLAIDRQILVDAGYGAAGQVTCNVLPAPAVHASTANDACKTQDVDEANRILDEAGWMPDDDGVRAKGGVRLSILYQTSTNSVRQGTQALVKQMWEQIGVETELRNVDAAVFFGGDPASPDTYMKFYADIEMYTNNFSGTDPESYMANWACSEIPGPENQWLGSNIPRSCVAEYDAMVAEMSQTASLGERARLAKEMNDILVQNHYMIPLIWRGDVSAHANTLMGVRNERVGFGAVERGRLAPVRVPERYGPSFIMSLRRGLPVFPGRPRRPIPPPVLDQSRERGPAHFRPVLDPFSTNGTPGTRTAVP